MLSSIKFIFSSLALSLFAASSLCFASYIEGDVVASDTGVPRYMNPSGGTAITPKSYIIGYNSSDGSHTLTGGVPMVGYGDNYVQLIIRDGWSVDANTSGKIGDNGSENCLMYIEGEGSEYDVPGYAWGLHGSNNTMVITDGARMNVKDISSDSDASNSSITVKNNGIFEAEERFDFSDGSDTSFIIGEAGTLMIGDSSTSFVDVTGTNNTLELIDSSNGTLAVYGDQSDLFDFDGSNDITNFYVDGSLTSAGNPVSYDYFATSGDATSAGFASMFGGYTVIGAPVAPIPEPSSSILLLLAVCGILQKRNHKVVL